MTQTIPTQASPSSFPRTDKFSAALMELFGRAKASIVRVSTGENGGGAGFIIDTGDHNGHNAHVLTNNHVVARNPSRVQITLLDGRKLEAKVLNREPQLDLALLQVNGDNLTAREIADSSKLRIGEWVFAIGHPYLLPWVVTAGILSGRSVFKTKDGSELHYLKSDVRLRPGNSGGPLLDADGRVVGINSMIFGGDLSVSIPSSVVTTWLNGLSRKQVRLGVEIQSAELPTQVRDKVQPTRETGVLIVGTRGRAEHLTDLLIGDVLLDVAGKPVTDPATLRRVLSTCEGETAPAKILRGGEIIEKDITLIVTEADSK
jgi:serine protease Do